MIEKTIGGTVIRHVGNDGGESRKRPPSPILTRLAFMDRFTTTELVAIYTDARSSVETEIFLDKMRAADDIDLTDTRTRDGVAQLEAAGLIGEGRADAVLTP